MSAPNQVIEAIKSGVRNGTLVPGQRLIELELSTTLRVSRQSVRQALSSLAADGIVEIERHRGARIKRFSPKEIVDLHQIREVLEGLAASLVSDRVADDPSIPKKLGLIQRAAKKAVAEQDQETFRQCNARLHEAIIDLSGNHEIKDQVAQARLVYFRLQTRFFSKADMIRSHGEHEAIIDAITKSRSALAERLMRRHIRSSRDTILRAVSASTSLAI